MTDFAITLQEAGPTDRDSYLDSGAPTTNFGDDSLIKIGKLVNFSDRHMRGIIGRDVSGDFPADAVIDTCGIKWVASAVSGNGPREATWYLVIDPWNWVELAVTYERRNSIVPWSTAGGDIELTTPAPVPWMIPETTGAYISWGMEDMLNWVLANEAGKFAVIGKKDVETTGNARRVDFYSSSSVPFPPQIVGTYHVPIYVGYKVFLKAGTLPNTATDTPIATVDSTVLSVALDIGALALAANTDYYGLIVAFNTVGDAVTGAPFGFRTDGAGLPLIIPTPVTNVKATPLAGGNVRVSWTYSEANPLSVADTFEIEVAGDPGTFPFSIPHVAPKRDYIRDLTVGEDGLFQVRVRAAKGGLYQANVSPVPVVLDATPPAVVPVTLEAVE